MKRIILSFILIAVAIGVRAKLVDYRHLMSSTPLGNDRITAIAKDPLGFIWLATPSALVRFDGHAFTEITEPSVAALFDSHRTILQLTAESPDRLWLCTTNGLWLYNLRSHQLSAEKGLENSRINSMLDRGDHFILNTSHGVVRRNKADGKLSTLFAHPDRQLSSMAIDRQGRLWLADDNALMLLRGGSKLKADTVLRLKDTHNVVIDSLGALWLWNREQLFTADITSAGKIANLRHHNIEVTAVKPVSRTEVIFCTRGRGNSIACRDAEGQLVVKEQILPTLQYDDLSSTTNAYFTDDLHNVWFGTRSGLFMLPRGHENRFLNISNSISNPTSLSHNTVSAIHVTPEGTLWVGTAYGLNRLTPSKDGFDVHRFIDERPEINHTKDNKIQQIAADRSGLLWLGTKGGVKFYNPSANRYVARPEITDRLKGCDFVRALLRDSRGNMWIGFQTGGLHLFDTSGQLRRINLPSSPTWDHCTCIAEDSRSRIWAGSTGHGLLRVTLSDGRITLRNYRIPTSHDRDADVQSLFIDRYGNLWVGTNFGLYKYNEEKDSFISMPLAAADDNVSIAGIIGDHSGNLWLASSRGVYKYNISEARSYFFQLYNGMFTRPGFVFTPAIDPKGNIYFSGVNGLTYFNPAEIRPDSTHCPIRFTDIRVNNRPLLPGDRHLAADINFADRITLDSDNNQFSFSFSALTYGEQPNRICYAYRLSGVDKDWVYSDASSPVITYNNLTPGTYTLLIKGTDLNGRWIDTPTSITVRVKPAFYQTWWFILFILSLCLIAGWVIFRAWKSHSDMRAQKEADRHRLDLYADISQSIRTPLNMLRAPLFDLAKNHSSLPEANIKYMLSVMLRNSSHLSLLMEQMIELKQIADGNACLHIAEADFTALLRTVYDGFADIYTDKGVQLSFHSNTDKALFPFDRARMETVIFNLLFYIYNLSRPGDRLSVTCLNHAESHRLTLEMKLSHPAGTTPPLRPDEDTVASTLRATLPLASELLRLHGSELTVNASDDTFSFTLATDLRPDRKALAEASVTCQALSESYASYIEQTAIENIPEDGCLPDAPIVYVADTDTALTDFIRNSFAPELKVTTFTSSAALREALRERKPAIIVCDTTFNAQPDGLQLCSAIKNNPSLSDILVILYSDRTADSDREDGYEAGCDAFIGKSLDITVLKRRTLLLLKKHDALRRKLRNDLISTPPKVEMQTSDDIFLAKCMKIIEANIANDEFNVEAFAAATNLSPSMLYRRIKEITHVGPNDFIKSIRLKRAAQLLASDALRISEVAEQVGFMDVRYFSTCFKKEFGVTPSQYRAEHFPANEQPSV